MKVKYIFLVAVIILIVTESFITSANADIFTHIRLPSMLLALFTGGALSLAGLRLQNLFDNELTSPFTLGLSSSCALGAALAELYGFNIFITAFVSSLFGTFLILMFWRIFKETAKSKIILAGVAVSFLFSAILMLVQYSSNQWDIFRITRWLMGSTQTVGYQGVLIIFLASTIFYIQTTLSSNKMDLYCLGNELALTQGLNVTRFEWITIFITSIATGVVVSYTGPIGFVGLMIPHLARLICKSTNLSIIHFSFIMGGILLLICQGLSRYISQGQLPEGVLTSLIGSVFFFILLVQKKRPL